MLGSSVDRVLCSGILAGAFISLYKCAMIKELFFAQLYNRFGWEVGKQTKDNKWGLVEIVGIFAFPFGCSIALDLRAG